LRTLWRVLRGGQTCSNQADSYGSPFGGPLELIAPGVVDAFGKVHATAAGRATSPCTAR
jgi:hypothetical protein